MLDGLLQLIVAVLTLGFVGFGAVVLFALFLLLLMALGALATMLLDKAYKAWEKGKP